MNEIAKTFQNEKGKYDDFRKKVDDLLRELLLQRDVRVHKIESRCKEVDKLDEKISRKNDKYNSISEITDIVGIRIITYFEDEVDIIASIIEEEFIKDIENSIDKRDLEMDRFGYKSLHYVVSLKDERKELTEYKRFKDIKFEIQIRSILQHAWAEIEHDIGYKSELSLPNSVKRNFYRVAALLETADIEFVKIKDQLKEYKLNISKEIENNPEEVEINQVSLRAYIDSEYILDLENEMVSSSNREIHYDSYFDGNLNFSDILHFLEITTIKELDFRIKSVREKLICYFKEFTDDSKSSGGFLRGISIFYLFYLLVGERQDLDYAIDFFSKKITKGNDDINYTVAKKIIDTYKKIQ